MNNPIPKAAFFDIDGTLVPYDTRCISQADCGAIETLRRQGTLIFIVTGRHISDINNIPFPVSGAVCSNGALTYTVKDGCGRDVVVVRAVHFVFVAVIPLICYRDEPVRGDGIFQKAVQPAAVVFLRIQMVDFQLQGVLVVDFVSHFAHDVVAAEQRAGMALKNGQVVSDEVVGEVEFPAFVVKTVAEVDAEVLIKAAKR